MQIGIPREIKSHEGRVALLPAQVEVLVAAGHTVHVETGAGRLSAAEDAAYVGAGARIAADAEALFAASELVVKVKEIMPGEYGYLRREQILLTNIHSALNRGLTDQLLEVGLTAFAAEDTHRNGSPNCPLAGEIGAFEGVRLCLTPHGGSGRHFMRHFGSAPLHAVVIGLGGVGQGALRTLLRLGCRVTGLDIDSGARYRTELAYPGAELETAGIECLPALLGDADLIVNCVMWDKSRSDHLITRADLARMRRTAVIADISCDTAGAVETTRPTTWAEPTYVEEGITHFCVDNIPGAASVTASAGYGRALLPHILAIAEHGPLQAARDNPWLARGLSFVAGELTHAETGRYQQRPFTPVEELLAR